MKEHYPDEITLNVANHLSRTTCAIFGRATILGLRKSEKFLNEFRHYFTGMEGYRYRFQKGHVSANKGQKMSAEQYKKCKGTMFKKGIVPKNHQPVGTITERSNYKRSLTYLYIKVAEPNKWEHLHRHIWEKENGPIPKGLNLVFKDGDFRNCVTNNLELITNKENMRRNTIHNRYAGELKEAIQALGYFKRKINTHERSKQGK